MHGTGVFFDLFMSSVPQDFFFSVTTKANNIFFFFGQLLAGNARFLGVAPGFLVGVGEVLCNFVKFLWFFSWSGKRIISCL